MCDNRAMKKLLKTIPIITLLALSLSLSACLGEDDKGDDNQQITTYVVTFDSNGGSIVESQNVNSGNKINKPNDPTRDGYKFLGWYNGDVLFDFETIINSNITLTAKWEEIIPDGGYGYNHYNGYYGNLTWKNSEDLKQKLHDIISKDINYIRYDNSSSVPTNWETNIYADHAYDDLEMLDVVYSKDDVLATKTQTGWQREHAFVASLMTGITTSNAVGAKQGRAVDFHNLFAANASGNQSRSDKNFGTVNKNDTNYTGYQEVAGSYKSNNKLFEPSDEDKGKLARAILYMTIMYDEDEQEDISLTLNYNSIDQSTYGQKSKTVHIPMNYKPLSLSDNLAENSLINYTNYYYAETEDIQNLVSKYGAGENGYASYVRDNASYSIGLSSDILSWANYPVDIQEYQHNQSVYSHVHTGYQIAQNNRNPLVDYPELTSYLFGDKKNEAGDLNNLKPTTYALDLEGNEIHHYAIKNATREFEVGDVFDKNAYKLVGINSNFEEIEISGDIDLTPSYTFVESDIGEKTMKIITDKNEIELKINVIAKQNDYSYQYIYSGDKTDFGNSDYIANETKTLNLNGETWSATSTHLANITNSNKFSAVQIGNGSGKEAETFTLISDRSFTDVDKFKLIINCASGKNCNVEVKIGDNIITSFTLTGYNDKNTTKEFELDNPLSGIVIIKF